MAGRNGLYWNLPRTTPVTAHQQVKTVKDNTRIARQTRLYRKLHKWIAIPLLLFLLTTGITGLLLGLKKQTGLLPPTLKGTSTNAEKWLGIDSIQAVAVRYASQTLQKPAAIDRIDIRPAKGTAKIVFAKHFTELQVDCTTGAILSVETRRSDIIEKIHDGSILDFLAGTGNDPIKVIYTSCISTGLILLSVSGFWLWYNPRKMKRQKSA